MQTHAKLFKYKIGLAVLGLFTIFMIVWVAVQGNYVKQDQKTFEAATKIAEDLNAYVDDKQAIPSSLAEASIHDVPSAISYSRLSDEQYKFCVTYKADNEYSSFDLTSTLTEVLRQYYSGENDYEAAELYISPLYQKGENCQTIKPYLFSSSFDDDWWNMPDYNWDSLNTQNNSDLFQQN